MSAFYKDILREVKGSLGRFLSILMIVAIGTAFFAGVKASVPDLERSGDHYFDTQNLLDIRILSDVGFNDEDVKSIQNVTGVQGVDATFSMDFIAQKGTHQQVVKTLAWKDLKKNDPNYINQPRVVEGRLPTRDNECLMESFKMLGSNYKIGDTITLSSGDESPISNSLKRVDYTIVGSAYFPDYISHDKGSSRIGSGKIDTFIMIPIENYRVPFFSEVRVRVQGAAAINTYSKDYFTHINPVRKDLEHMGKERSSARFEEIKRYPSNMTSTPQIPSWYVLDRNSHYSYRDYGSVAERMDGIAKVFPVFFLLVAALVCLTTMTRMVDEQRGVIGTYKALGYSKLKISIKYIAYSLIAGVLGSILGCLIGMHLFPLVIFEGWNIIYNIPTLLFEPQLPLALFSSACVVGVGVAATIFACYKDLVEVPAALMRPKAPKNGKTILLERIPFLWSRFSFTHKVSARNIFRYKKRFFMTIIGISGCTALLLSGFGIRDSIAQIVDIQYGEITQYDATIKLEDNAPLERRLALIEESKTLPEVYDSVATSTLSATTKVDSEEHVVTITIPDNTKKIDDFIQLRTRVNHTPLPLSNKGAIISEKLAKSKGLSEGDSLSITLSNEKTYPVKVHSICENYVGHIMYMTPTYYTQLTGQSAQDNTLLLKLKENNKASELALGNHFMNNESVASMTFYRGVAKSFQDTIVSISFVTYVLIGAAALLAFVVLYNLTNVNISERQREIATIKVLGFYDREVAAYVYRETILLTLIGALLGCGLGYVLHQLIMDLAEMPDVMFGRNINIYSYIYSIAITLAFSIIVNVFMYKKLTSIPMVESLKSIE